MSKKFIKHQTSFSIMRGRTNMSGSVRNLVLFCVSLVLPLVIYRTLVFVVYVGRPSPLRALTGLTVHHLHYGVIILTVAVVMLILWQRGPLSVILAGLGLGLILDEFIPSLLLQTQRAEEIAAYTRGFVPTIVLFLVLLLAIVVVWRLRGS